MWLICMVCVLCEGCLNNVVSDCKSSKLRWLNCGRRWRSSRRCWRWRSRVTNKLKSWTRRSRCVSRLFGRKLSASKLLWCLLSKESHFTGYTAWLHETKEWLNALVVFVGIVFLSCILFCCDVAHCVHSVTTLCGIATQMALKLRLILRNFSSLPD